MKASPLSASKSLPMHNSLRLVFAPGFYLMLAIITLLIPLKWCFAFLFAGLFHELCHFAAVRLCGGSVPLLHIGNNGATMEAWDLPCKKALLCTLAGPLGSLLLLPFARWYPRLALCAATQALFNLLPLAGLDGGHALHHILHWLLPQSIAEKLCRYVQNGLLLACFATGIYCTFVLKLGLFPVLISITLILKSTNGKIPCK